MGIMDNLSKLAGKVADALKKGVGGAKPPTGPAAPAAPTGPAAPAGGTPKAAGGDSTLTAAPGGDATSLEPAKPKPDDDTRLDEEEDKDDQPKPADKKPSGEGDSAVDKASDTFWDMVADTASKIMEKTANYKEWGQNAKDVAGMTGAIIAAPVTLPLEAAKGIKEAGKAAVEAGKELGVDVTAAKDKLANSPAGQAISGVASKAGAGLSEGLSAAKNALFKDKATPDGLEPGGKTMDNAHKSLRERSASNPGPERKVELDAKAELKVDPSEPNATRKRARSAPPPPKPGKPSA